MFKRVCCSVLVFAGLVGCATEESPRARELRIYNEVRREAAIALTSGDVHGASAIYEIGAKKLPVTSPWWSALLSSSAQVYSAQGQRTKAVETANNCYLYAKPDVFCSDTLEYLRTGKQFSQEALILAAQRRLSGADDVADEPPAAAPSVPMVLNPALPAPGTPFPGLTNGSTNQGNGFPRTYCVHPKISHAADGMMVVDFQNNCPIAVVVAWCELLPNNACTASGGSNSIAPGGSYRTRFVNKTAVNVRHLACSDRAAGYDTVPTKSEWRCSPDRK